MMKIARLLLVSGLAVSVPVHARPADRFDLACTGRMTLTATQGARGAPIQQAKAFATRYRIDLVGRRWCAANCGAIDPIASVGRNQIVLRQPPTAQGGQSLTLNRLTGALDGTVVMADPVRRMQATGRLRAACRALPFSGFPARKF
jgi:hypothetical protein